MKKLLSLCLFMLSSTSFAMEALNESELQNVEGQAGADISLTLSLNHTSTYQLDTNLCGASGSNDIRNCRIAVNFNNRQDANGNKQWLVFKGIQGTIKIPKMGLDGADLKYVSDTTNTEIIKPAILLSFSKNYPILIRNFGFDTMAIETDNPNATSNENKVGYYALNSGGSTESNYSNTYVNGRYTVAGYDNGREVGFTGIKMNGNLSLNNKLMIFSCDSGHPRC